MRQLAVEVTEVVLEMLHERARIASYLVKVT
jgi:hypothetical protein